MRRTGNRAMSWLVVAAVTAMLSPVSMSFAAVANNEVTSVKIKEADGTSGQSTNTGSGVKTGHIQDGAVTGAKIADGAVTDAKIGGTISQSKVSGLESAIDGKSNITHNHDDRYQKKYGKVVVVAKTGGDYTSPLDALNDTASWCGISSASNPCLIRLMPGSYDINSSTLYMKEFVDIEGSGENVTWIKGNPESLLWGANNAEIRFLSLEQYGAAQGNLAYTVYAGELINSFRVSHVSILVYGVANAHAIYSYHSSLTLSDVTATSTGTYDNIVFLVDSSLPKMKNVRLQAHGGTFRNCGIKTQFASDAILSNVTIVADRGIENERSSVIISDATIKAPSDWGIYNVDSTATISNTNVEAQNGVYNFGKSTTNITIDHSIIKANVTAVYNNNAANIGQTKLDGTLAGTGTFKCYGVYNSSYQGVNCP